MMNHFDLRIHFGGAVVSAALVACAGDGVGSTSDRNSHPVAIETIENIEAIETDATDEGASSCRHLPTGPLETSLVMQGLDNTEDIVFDKRGHFAALKPNAEGTNDIVLVDAAGQATVLAHGFGQTLGTRYRPDGTLVAALLDEANPLASRVIEVAPDGTVNRNYATGLAIPNGLSADFEGNVFVTEFAGTRVLRITRDKKVETVVDDPSLHGPNGIFLDAKRRKLFYTGQAEGGGGELWSIDPYRCGSKPVKVVSIPRKNLDGITLDACGHLYGVARDTVSKRYGVYRVRLDGRGEIPRRAPADPVEALADISDLPSSASSLQFGSGPGFDRKNLYVVGPQGALYAVPVGVTGAPLP